MNCYKIEYQHKPPAYVFAESFAGAEEVSDNQFASHQIKSIKILGPALLPIPTMEGEE